jgi:hypothetical protein
VAELVDAHGSGPCAARCGGSSPSVGTKCKKGVCESRLPFFTSTSKAPACFAGGTRKLRLASRGGVAERDRVSVGTQCKKGVCESRLPFFTSTSGSSRNTSHAGRQFFESIKTERRWIPACAGMTFEEFFIPISLYRIRVKFKELSAPKLSSRRRPGSSVFRFILAD